MRQGVIMRFSFITGSLITIMALAACSKHESAAPQLSCDNPQMVTEIQQQLQQSINTDARHFAQNDSRQFIDADKIIAAASQLIITLTPAQPVQDKDGVNSCESQLSIAIPPNIWQQAETNAPIVFGSTNYVDRLHQQIQNSNLHLADHTFIQPFTYPAIDKSPAASAASSTISLNSSAELQLMRTALNTALLPYGIKDTLLINGHNYSRADTLALVIQQLNPQNSNDNISMDAKMASAILNGHDDQTKSVPSENNTPDPTAAKLQQAMDNNQNANNELKRLWQSLDNTVRTTLESGQQQWLAQKNKACHDLAISNTSANEDELIRLQCDTRQINQRLHYLRGFSLG